MPYIGHAIRHWTMFTPSPGLYLMNKEQKVKISKDFEQKSEGVIPFMNFMITLGVCASLFSIKYIEEND